MLLTTLQTLFNRDLEKLNAELALYQTESRIWYVEKSIANSAGNLCLHLLGNLNTYIGAGLGQMEYVRDRDREFADSGVPRADLLRALDQTKAVVHDTLARLPATALAQEYPLLVFDHPTSTEYLLVHLTTHLAYHLGQVNYHRRLLDDLEQPENLNSPSVKNAL